MRLFLVTILLCLTPAWGKLTFEAEIVKVDAPLGAEFVTANFKFKNSSDKLVKINRVEKNCVCLSVMVKDGKLNYQPGEEGVIRAEFKIGNKKGIVDELIPLYLDGDLEGEPSIDLIARINIPELISLKPKTLKWGVGSKPERQAINISILDGHSIKIIKTKSTSPNFETKLEIIEDGSEYKLWVSPKDTSTPGIAVIGIVTDAKFESEREQQGFAMVERP